MLASRLSPLALAIGSAILLAACGGGGGGGSTSSGGGTATPTSVTVTPSLGKFSTGCDVVLLDASGNTLGSGKIGSDGAATIAVGSYTGIVIAQVRGSSGCQYYDESTRAPANFGSGQTLSAVVDTTRTQVGINALTNLAATRLLDGNKLAAGKTSSDVQTENLSIQRMFQVSDMLSPATPIGSSSDKLTNTGEADKLALVLAALSELADIRGTDVHTLATQLASDLAADGKLDTLDATTLQNALADAANRVAAPSTLATFTKLASNTTLVPRIADVSADVTKVMAAGSAIDQARKLFADLRTNLMALTNDAATGSLDKEQQQLADDFQSGISIDVAFKTLTLLSDAALGYFVNGETGSISSSAGMCAGSMVSASCLIYGSSDTPRYLIVLAPGSTAGLATWNVSASAPSTGGPLVNLSGLTGTLTLGIGGFTANGKLQPMTGDTAYTAVNLTALQSGFTVGARKWSGAGTFDAIKSDGSSALKATIGSLAVDEAAYTANLALVLTGPHHRFDGNLNLSGKLAAADGSNEQPRTGVFTGSFTNTTSGLKIFDGTLTASQNWTASGSYAGYDPRQAESGSNYAQASVSFIGTVSKAANVAGLAIELSGNNNAGHKRQVANFKITSGGVIVSGTGTQSQTASGDTWDWALSNENGLKASYANATRSGKVTKADGTEVGTISTQRVSFVDGTYESLL